MVNSHEVYRSICPYKVGFPACVPVASILCKYCRCTPDTNVVIEEACQPVSSTMCFTISPLQLFLTRYYHYNLICVLGWEAFAFALLVLRDKCEQALVFSFLRTNNHKWIIYASCQVFIHNGCVWLSVSVRVCIAECGVAAVCIVECLFASRSAGSYCLVVMSHADLDSDSYDPQSIMG